MAGMASAACGLFGYGECSCPRRFRLGAAVSLCAGSQACYKGNRGACGWSCPSHKKCCALEAAFSSWSHQGDHPCEGRNLVSWSPSAKHRRQQCILRGEARFTRQRCLRPNPSCAPRSARRKVHRFQAVAQRGACRRHRRTRVCGAWVDIDGGARWNSMSHH